MKVAPVLHALNARRARVRLVHTGQHYDEAMSGVFFKELALPTPDVSLGVGSGSHAQQTARIMLAFEPVLRRERPDMVVVAGDVNSTLACALTSATMQIPVAHIEAGLRSRDMAMPEELNRVATDHLATLLFAPSGDAVENLIREGIGHSSIRLVGNVMIDTLFEHLDAARARRRWVRYGVSHSGYALVTLHRPSNVDRADTLAPLLDTLAAIQRMLPVVFPIHPRTRARLKALKLERKLARIVTTPPLGYVDFLSLLASAKLVLTDSGGIQEEAAVLRVPCITLRDRTERPVTMSQGSNMLVSRDHRKVMRACRAVLAGRARPGRPPRLWDGHAAERIAGALLNGHGSRP